MMIISYGGSLNLLWVTEVESYKPPENANTYHIWPRVSQAYTPEASPWIPSSLSLLRKLYLYREDIPVLCKYTCIVGNLQSPLNLTMNSCCLF